MGFQGNIRRFTAVVGAWLTLVPFVAAQSGRVTLQGRNFKLNGQEFYPVVMNYEVDLVSNINQSTDPDDIYFSVASKYDANLFSYYECSGESSCTGQLVTHLAKMVSMGFNAIRLGCPIILHQDSATAQKFYQLKVRYNNGQWPTEYRVDLDLPTFASPVAEKCFEILRSVVHLADSMGLKTILLCAEDDAGGLHPDWQLTLAEDTEAVSLYEAYVGRLAEELKDEQGLLAYDLWNEPVWTANHLTALTKAQVCEYTGRWYDAIHTAAPLQLVTLGGSAYHEIGSWDPAVMKLDFYSPHIYPGPHTLDGYDLQSANERVKAELYWLAADCPMPWLLGETGFIAEDDTLDPLDVHLGYTYQHLDNDSAHHAMPWMGGTEQQQAYYAQLSLDAVRAYGGSGYSWWDFQNTRVSWLLAQSEHPTEPEKWLQGGFFGLLKFGNHIPLNDPHYIVWQTTHPWRDKLAVSTFADYDPGAAPTALPAPPANYYNWFGTGGEVYREYTLRDQDDVPVANALATVPWLYHDPAFPTDLTRGPHLWDRNPTDAAGHTIIRKPHPWAGYDAPAAQELKLEFAGGPSITHDLGQWPTTGSTIDEIVRKRLYFTHTVHDAVVAIGSYRDFRAWSALTVLGTVVEGDGTTGGVANMHARDEVHLGTESHIQAGSEAHLYTDRTFLACEEVVAGMQMEGQRSRVVSPTANKSATRTGIELRFERSVATAYARPNPCTTELWIGYSLPNAAYEVLDNHGATVLSGAIAGVSSVLSTSHLPTGQYTLRVWTGTDSMAIPFTKH